MITPPVTPEYNSSSQAVLNTVIEKADNQNLKLDQDNFLETGSICLQNGDGAWYKLGLSPVTGGVVSTVGSFSSGDDYNVSSYSNVPLGGGSGTGVKATVIV